MLSKYSSIPSVLCVYVGAAPSHHHPFLQELFPNIIWHLYDPAEFAISPIKGKVHIHRVPFTTELARHWEGKVDIFICDFRRGTPDDAISFEIQVAEDMSEQIVWARAIQPKIGSMLKFRPPYIGISVLDTVKYPKGRILYQTWNSYASTEGRHIILPDELNIDMDFNVRHYQDSVTYLNLILRPWSTYTPPVSGLHKVNGYDRCHNCTTEANTWVKYLEYSNYTFQENTTSVDKMIKITGDKFKQYLFIPEASRNKKNTSHVNQDSAIKDRLSKHGDFSKYPAPRRNLLICNGIPVEYQKYTPPKITHNTPKRPILIFGDNSALQIGFNPRYAADFTPDAKDYFVSGVSFNCGLQCLVEGNYDNHITTMFKYWNESATRLRDTPLDLILILGNHDLSWDYFYRYRVNNLSDERFYHDFISNYDKILNENLKKFPNAQITVIGALPYMATDLSWVEPKEELKTTNLEGLRTQHKEITLEDIVKKNYG